MSKIEQYSHIGIYSFLAEIEKQVKSGKYYDFSAWGRMQSPSGTSSGLPTVPMESVDKLPEGGVDSGDKSLYGGINTVSFAQFMTDFQKAVASGKTVEEVVFFPSRTSQFIRADVLWSEKKEAKREEKQEPAKKSEETPPAKTSKSQKASKAKS